MGILQALGRGGKSTARREAAVNSGQSRVQSLFGWPPTLRLDSQSLTARSENMIRRLLSLIWGTPCEWTNCQNEHELLPE